MANPLSGPDHVHVRLILPAAKLTFGNPRRGSGEAASQRGMNLAVGAAYGDHLS